MIKFPPYTSITTNNGIPIHTITNQEFPVVQITIIWPQGTLGDPPGKEGLTQTFFHMIQRGNSQYSPSELDELLDFEGISLQSYAHHQQSVINFESLSEKKQTIFDLLPLTLLNQTFYEEEFEKFISRRIESILKIKENPSQITNRAGAMSLFGPQSFGRPSGGTPVTLKNISLQDCQQFPLKFHGTPTIFMAGDVDKGDIQKLLSIAENLPIDGPSHSIDSDSTQFQDPAIWLIDKPESPQVQIKLLTKGPSFHDKLFIPFQLGNLILGGSFNSRLMQSIRVNQGLTYSIQSRIQALNDAVSVFSITSFTRPEQVDSLIESVRNEIKIISHTPPPKEELIRNCNYLEGQYPLSFETINHLINHLIQIELLHSSIERLESLPELFRACKPEDINTAFSQYIQPEQLHIIMTGPADLIIQHNPILSNKKIVIKTVDDIIYSRNY